MHTSKARNGRECSALDGIRLSDHEHARSLATLVRAEAIADFIVSVVRSGRGILDAYRRERRAHPHPAHK